MEVLLCGAGEHWSPHQLADSMKFDHGYTSQSVPVRCAARHSSEHGCPALDTPARHSCQQHCAKLQLQLCERLQQCPVACDGSDQARIPAPLCQTACMS